MHFRKYILFFLSLFIISASIAQQNITAQLMGKWEATDSDGITGSLNFIDSVHIIVSIPNQTLSEGTYLVDTSKDPMWFDITLKQGNIVLVMKGLIKIINENAIKWQISTEGERSETFRQAKTDNVIVLKRKV